MPEENIEQPPKPNGETPREGTKPQDEKESALYKIKKTKDGFEVTFPGLLDKKREALVGTSTKRFKTREEAQEEANKIRADVGRQLELASLEKTFSSSSRIDMTPDGKFRVLFPGGLHDPATGRYIGIGGKDFDSWKEAKEFFLQQRERGEKLTHNPLLEIKTAANERVAFSALDAFNPSVAPSEQPHSIPTSVEKYLMNNGRLDGSDPSALTYQETIKQKNWEKELFSFVSSYLENEGAATAKELGIDNLDALTPKQAVELSSRLVVDLTKYKKSDTRKPEGITLVEPEKTQADQSTVLQLLQENLRRRNDPDWEGNGVCRNQASAVKAVFEALKANQTKFSRLRDTYCLFESGMDAFNPRRNDTNVLEINKTGHAWNTFVTISKEGSANAVIVDTTWGRRNLDTGEVEGLDHTLTRMEPIVHAIGRDLPDSAPEKEEQLKHILSYYSLKIEASQPPQVEIVPNDELSSTQREYYTQTALDVFGDKYDLSNLNEDQLVELGQDFIAKLRETQAREKQDSERQFFTTRALDLMTHQGVPDDLPQGLVDGIEKEYQKLAGSTDKSELETLYNLSKANPSVDFQSILRGYLKDKQLQPGYSDRLFIFNDDTLQKAVFEELKGREDFDKFLKEGSAFRIRMREALPGLFVGFYPEEKPEDAMELSYMIKESVVLRNLMIDSRGQSADRIKTLFGKVRQSLKDVNPQGYEAISSLDDYQIVKHYDKLYSRLKAAL